MIRLAYFLRRRPELSLEAFQSTWLHDHGPLVAKHATLLRIRRYVQAHARPDDPAGRGLAQTYGTGGEPYDGVAELWWKSERDLQQALEAPEAQAAAEELLADERRFIDFSRSTLWFAVEMPQIHRPGSLIAREASPYLKGFYVGRLAAGVSAERAQFHWFSVHGALARQYAEVLPFERYIQVHRIETPLTAALRAARGGMEDFPSIGHGETWIDRRSLNLPPGPEAQEAFSLLAADIATFVDVPASTVFVAKEHVIVDRKIFTPPLPSVSD